MNAGEATDYNRLAELLAKTKAQAERIEALEAAVVALGGEAERANDAAGGIRVIGRNGVAEVLITASDGTTSHVMVNREDVLATAAGFAAIAFDRMLDDGMAGDEIWRRFVDAVERESKAGVARGREMQA